MSQRTARTLVVVTVILLAMAATTAAFAAPDVGQRDNPHAGAPRKGGGFRLIRQTADHLGVAPSVVMNELRQGKTLAEVAAAHGKSRESLRAALIAESDKHIEKASQGDLKLTADEVRVLQGIAARAVDLALDRKWPGKR